MFGTWDWVSICVIAVSAAGAAANAVSAARARLRLDSAKAVSGLILADAVVSGLGCVATVILTGLVSSGVSNRAVCTMFFACQYFPSYFGSAVNALIAVLRCAIVARSYTRSDPEDWHRRVAICGTAAAVLLLATFVTSQLLQDQPVHILQEMCLNGSSPRSTRMQVAVLGIFVLAFTVVALLCDAVIVKIVITKLAKSGTGRLTASKAVEIPVRATLLSSLLMAGYLFIVVAAANALPVSKTASAGLVSALAMVMAGVRAPLALHVTFSVLRREAERTHSECVEKRRRWERENAVKERKDRRVMAVLDEGAASSEETPFDGEYKSDLPLVSNA